MSTTRKSSPVVPLPATGHSGWSTIQNVAFQPKAPPAKSTTVVEEPQDSVFKPRSIRTITAEISEPDMTQLPSKKVIQLETAPRRGAYTSDPFANATATWLHDPAGGWMENTLHGPVSPFCYLPTYFEDRSLERFGDTHGPLMQPILSSADFVFRVAALPYLMSVELPWQHRPPNYLPPPTAFSQKAMHYARSIQEDGVAGEAGAIALMFLIFP